MFLLEKPCIHGVIIKNGKFTGNHPDLSSSVGEVAEDTDSKESFCMVLPMRHRLLLKYG